VAKASVNTGVWRCENHGNGEKHRTEVTEGGWDSDESFSVNTGGWAVREPSHGGHSKDAPKNPIPVPLCYLCFLLFKSSLLLL
jgi:hypothetical protein